MAQDPTKPNPNRFIGGFVLSIVLLACSLIVDDKHPQLGLVYLTLGLALIVFLIISESYTINQAKKLEPYRQFFNAIPESARQTIADDMLRGIAQSIFEAQSLGSEINESFRMSLYKERQKLIKDLGLTVPENYYHWRNK